MADLKMVLDKANEIKLKIDSVLKYSTYEDYDDLSGLDINYKDSEQLFLLDQLQEVMKGLDEVKDRLEYLSLPVREVSRLHRNGSGRYETGGGHYYTCGSPIEALVQDERREVPYWVWTRLESNDKGPYLVGYGNVDLDGLTVRVRGEG